MATGRYLFSSESVSGGHPDKLADQISDGILDALLAQDPFSRVACETLVTTGIAIIAGEITTKAVVDYSTVVRDVIREVGYTDDELGICADTCAVMVSLDRQSPDIAQGVDENVQAGKEIGAGDQGLMFGYACDDTPELMPLPIALANRVLLRLTEARKQREVPWLRPDSKSQVTIEYDGDKPVRVDTVVVSTQHAPEVSHEDIRRFVINQVIRPCLPQDLVNGEITYHINPTGRFVRGGPHGDCGLTGRKIIVDTYGGGAAMVAALSAARIRPKSIAAPPTWLVTWPRTWSPPAWRTAVKYNSPTPSVSANRSASTWIRRVRDASRTIGSAS